jgi:hypothetical protein
MTNISELENLAKAEIRIRNLISKERQSFQDFVQAATEFHKPGLTQTKQELDSVQAGLTDIQQASVQKALSKVPDATPTADAPAADAPAADAPATQTTIQGTDNFFGLVNKDGKLVFGISTVYSEAMNSEIDYQITVSAAAISAVKSDGNRLDKKYAKTLLDYINNNRATTNLSGVQEQNYKNLIDFTIAAEINMLRDPIALVHLYKAGFVLSRFKKYTKLKQWYGLPDQDVIVMEAQRAQTQAQPTQEQAQEQAQPSPEQQRYEQLVRERIELLKTAEPQVVTGFKDRYPDEWKRLEQHSPAEMERIKQRVFTPRQQPVESSPDSSDSSFRSPETPEKTGKGHTPYKRLAVLLGAAKTGVKDENRTEFIAILDKLMGKRLIDRRARELLLSRFNKS